MDEQLQFLACSLGGWIKTKCRDGFMEVERYALNIYDSLEWLKGPTRLCTVIGSFEFILATYRSAPIAESAVHDIRVATCSPCWAYFAGCFRERGHLMYVSASATWLMAIRK